MVGDLERLSRALGSLVNIVQIDMFALGITLRETEA
jgi:hypothetical protein